MGLLDNYTGIGMSPRPTFKHQEITFDLAKAFDDYIDSDFAVFTEACIDPKNLNSPAPDVIIFEGNPAENYYAIPVVFVEVYYQGRI